jgi:hypothetical protein
MSQDFAPRLRRPLWKQLMVQQITEAAVMFRTPDVYKQRFAKAIIRCNREIFGDRLVDKALQTPTQALDRQFLRSLRLAKGNSAVRMGLAGRRAFLSSKGS